MTEEFIRRPDYVSGPLTPKEEQALEAHMAEWVAISRRTSPTDPALISAAIKALYAVAKLPEPQVYVAPSIAAMAYAYGTAAVCIKNDITPDYHGEPNVVLDLVSKITGGSQVDPGYRLYGVASTAAEVETLYRDTAMSIAGPDAVDFAIEWWRDAQGGAYWASYDAYLTAMRDVLGLRLPEYEAYKPWEEAARHGCYRVLRNEFCIVTDFPKLHEVDAEGAPHCEWGPSMKWRDGWETYHWHGVRLPDRWIQERDTIPVDEILREPDVELRAIGAEIIGWPRVMGELGAKVLDGDPDSDMGALVEMTLPGLETKGRFLVAVCPRNGKICEGVPHVDDNGSPIETVMAAQAWRTGEDPADYQHPPIRT